MGVFTAHELCTNRPSFAAANQVATLMHVTNERVVSSGALNSTPTNQV